jgi:hypothetical protein
MGQEPCRIHVAVIITHPTPDSCPQTLAVVGMKCRVSNPTDKPASILGERPSVGCRVVEKEKTFTRVCQT